MRNRNIAQTLPSPSRSASLIFSSAFSSLTSSPILNITLKWLSKFVILKSTCWYILTFRFGNFQTANLFLLICVDRFYMWKFFCRNESILVVLKDSEEFAKSPERDMSFHIWNCKLYECNVQWIDRYEVCKANMRRRWIQFGDLRIVKSSFVIIVLSPDPLSKSLFRFVTKIIQFPFTEFLSFKIPFYICDEKYTSFQKALFKVPKICNTNFWIENDPPSLWHFSKNSSALVVESFP